MTGGCCCSSPFRPPATARAPRWPRGGTNSSPPWPTKSPLPTSNPADTSSVWPTASALGECLLSDRVRHYEGRPGRVLQTHPLARLIVPMICFFRSAVTTPRKLVSAETGRLVMADSKASHSLSLLKDPAGGVENTHAAARRPGFRLTTAADRSKLARARAVQARWRHPRSGPHRPLLHRPCRAAAGMTPA